MSDALTSARRGRSCAGTTPAIPDAGALRAHAAAAFPPEPPRSAVIQLTVNRLAAADRRHARRGLWLGALDRLGLGFDS